MAEALFAQGLAQKPGLSLRTGSAGLCARAGREAPADARQAATSLGVSLASHRATLLDEELAAAADVIVIMDRRNEAMMAARFPGAMLKTFLLGSLAPTPDADIRNAIEDPYGLGPTAVSACYHRIQRGTAALLTRLEALQ